MRALPASAARHHPRHRSRHLKLATGCPHHPLLSARIHPAFNPAPGPPPRPCSLARPLAGTWLCYSASSWQDAYYLCYLQTVAPMAWQPHSGGPPGTVGPRSGHGRQPTVLTQQHFILQSLAHPKQHFRSAGSGTQEDCIWSLRELLFQRAASPYLKSLCLKQEVKGLES